MALGRKRLLIVEDDPDTLDVLSAWAEHEQCEVRTARSGYHALQISRAFKPRVLITDYLLEDDLTGVDLIVRIRRLSLDVTCVLITSALRDAMRAALDRIDGVIILAKPMSYDRLRQIVAAA
jgi:two-component system OmpR family response regulator